MLLLALLESAAPLSGAAAVLVLAVLQGLAEFLPISSSGHLVLGRSVLGLREAGLALDVALHVGTLAAVVAAYRLDVRRLIGDVLTGRWHLFLWLVLATIPAGAAGMLFKDRIEAAAQTTHAAGAGLLVTAVLLTIGEWARGRNERRVAATPEPQAAVEARIAHPPYRLAVLIGLAQVLALWPGISRSGTTIAAGLLLGLPGVEAARLSFLMSLPAVSGAAVVELPHALEEGFTSVSPGWVAAAVVVAGLVGWAALRLLLLVLKRGAFRWFAAYCAVLGVATLVWL